MMKSFMGNGEMQKMTVKFIAMVIIISGLAFAAGPIGLNMQQTVAVCAFMSCILGTLFFWEFRLSFAFAGASALLLTRSIDMKHFIDSASFDVILFLVGMMIVIGLLKETGFFAWIVMLILQIRGLTARKFLIVVCVFSALLACAIDEVTSIIFMVAAIFEICDYFEVDPVPYLISSIITTNIGSAGTVLGNPIGILIAAKAGLTFEDFFLNAFPIMIAALLATIFMFLIMYRKHLKKLDEHIKEFGDNEILRRLISVPPDKQLRKALLLFAITLVFIALHHRLEQVFGLDPNSVLLIVPLVSASIVMTWKWKRARSYVEKDVEWWTLLFFIFLFAQAGALKYTGATDIFAKHIAAWAGGNSHNLTGIILWLSAFGSSTLDNVVVVAASIPIVQSFLSIGAGNKLLWWALLFGGCFGGNITLIGSTANIVALGILEKEKRTRISFAYWLKIGLPIGVVTISIVWLSLFLLSYLQR